MAEIYLYNNGLHRRVFEVYGYDGSVDPEVYMLEPGELGGYIPIWPEAKPLPPSTFDEEIPPDPHNDAGSFGPNAEANNLWSHGIEASGPSSGWPNNNPDNRFAVYNPQDPNGLVQISWIGMGENFPQHNLARIYKDSYTGGTVTGTTQNTLFFDYYYPEIETLYGDPLIVFYWNARTVLNNYPEEDFTGTNFSYRFTTFGERISITSQDADLVDMSWKYARWDNPANPGSQISSVPFEESNELGTTFSLRTADNSGKSRASSIYIHHHLMSFNETAQAYLMENGRVVVGIVRNDYDPGKEYFITCASAAGETSTGMALYIPENQLWVSDDAGDQDGFTLVPGESITFNFYLDII